MIAAVTEVVVWWILELSINIPFFLLPMSLCNGLYRFAHLVIYLYRDEKSRSVSNTSTNNNHDKEPLMLLKSMT